MPGEHILVIDDSPTILKVVQVVLSKAGFNVRTAPDGQQGILLARELRPALILLDFVMPNMNGYQVCRALAEDQSLKDVPVVLMSAKGDQVGERFVKALGIVDYITKPFSPEAITAVVTHTVHKYRSAEGETVDEAAPQIMIGRSNGELSGGIVTRTRREALASLREAIAARIAGASANPNGGAADLSARVLAALDDETLESLVAQVGAACPELALGADAVLTGALDVVPLGEVLQLLHLQAQSGTLSVTRSSARIEIHFRGGAIDLATSAGVSEEFLIGRFVVEQKLMTAEEFDRFLKSRKEPGRLVGVQLIELGKIDDGALKQLLSRQSCELVYEALRWRFGRFVFRPTRELPAPAAHAALGLPVEGILMEGFRRVDEWHLIEREIDGFDVVFLRNEDTLSQVGRGRLTREELTVLELVDGRNSVKDIIRISHLSSFDVSKMLYRLLSIKLIRKRLLSVAV